MSELDDFLTPTLDRQLEAEKALINGDPGLRLAMWSTQDPVTVFGAEKSVIGSEAARQVFRWLANRFSNCTDYRFELAVEGRGEEVVQFTHGPSRWCGAAGECGDGTQPVVVRRLHGMASIVDADCTGSSRPGLPPSTQHRSR